MIDTSHVQELLEREVSRKEFLRYVGVAFLSVIGVTNLLKNLNQPLHLPAQSSSTRSNELPGYGMSAYGR